MSSPGAAVAQAQPRPAAERRPTLGLLLLVAGLVGLAAAFTLMVEKVNLLQDPTYVPTCSVNALLSCTGVMTSPQASVLGFPNPLLGIAGFSIVAATGAGLLAGARLRAWYWAGLQLGLSAAFVFVHWLIAQSLFVIEALCPYCIIVWVVTAAVFWGTTVRNLTAWGTGGAERAGRPARAGALRRLAQAVRSFWLVPLTIWYLAVLLAVVVVFRQDIVVVLST